MSLILDETSDIVNKSQLSTVVRYVDENCEVQERFLHFTDMSSDRSSDGLLQHVKQLLMNFHMEGKLVAQTYDGAAVMAGHQNGLNKKVRDVEPSAIFVHCYSHQLNLTLQQSAKLIPKCTLFFQTLSSMASFFSRSPLRTDALQDFVQKRLPRVAPTRWNFTSRLVNTVMENYENLKTFFQHVLENSQNWEDDCIDRCLGYFAFLDKFQTRFLITVFSRIFSLTDTLFEILQSKGMDILYCGQKIQELIENVKKIKESDFELIFQESFVLTDASFEMRRTETPDLYKHLFQEITDNILTQLTSRFKTISELEFFNLLNSSFFSKHNKQFPETALKSLDKHYGRFFDVIRLKNELIAIYCMSDFDRKSVLDILKSMHDQKLYLGMPELFKLAKLVVSIPSSSASAERSFSALKRIHTYCRSTQKQNRPSSLSLMAIEKSLLVLLQKKPAFFDNVIENFVKKNRRVDFLYR